MPSVYELLDPFTHIDPGRFISKYQDWIFFTLLVFFFWSIIGISLKKRFPDSRHLRVLTTSTSLLLATGMYYSIYRGWLHIDFQSFGMFGAILLFIIVFFILFGLMRGYGLHANKALPITYTLFYIGLWSIAPNLTDTIADIFPPLNGIMLILFIYSAFKTITMFFRSSKEPKEMAKDLNHTTPLSKPEIEREIHEDKHEMKLLKKKSLKLTKIELNTVKDIEAYLMKMLHLIEDKGDTLDQKEIDDLTEALENIQRKENILKKGSTLLDKHIYAYKTKHKQDLPELEDRLKKAKQKKRRQEIEEELFYQKKMLQAIDFMQQYETRLVDFLNSFNSQLSKAVQSLRGNYPHDSLIYIQNAYKNLQGTKQVYVKLQEFEKYLIKMDKRLISDLKEEKDPL